MDDTAESVSSPKVDHVLVPLDGSEFAFRAIHTGLELANRFDAEMHTISLATNQKELERLSVLVPASLQEHPGDKSVRVEIGVDPAEAIARRARELEACLVCLTTQGRGRLDGAVMGSVARSVIQRSTGPIVALGPLANNPEWSPPPRNWPKPLSIPRMVACVDGTETSEQVLPIATAWAQALGMSLTILTVVDDSTEYTWTLESRSRYGPGTDPEAYIEGLVQQWSEVLPTSDGEVVRDPIGPARGIQTHLGKRPAGLLALTTHARSGMHRVRFGARAANIVRTSVAPCLVARVAAQSTDSM